MHLTSITLQFIKWRGIQFFLPVTDASLVWDHLCAHLSLEEGAGRRRKSPSVFTLRTEEASAKQYFQFYGYLSQQQNMMQVCVCVCVCVCVWCVYKSVCVHTIYVHVSVCMYIPMYKTHFKV